MLYLPFTQIMLRNFKGESFWTEKVVGVKALFSRQDSAERKPDTQRQNNKHVESLQLSLGATGRIFPLLNAWEDSHLRKQQAQLRRQLAQKEAPVSFNKNTETKAGRAWNHWRGNKLIISTNLGSYCDACTNWRQTRLLFYFDSTKKHRCTHTH